MEKLLLSVPDAEFITSAAAKEQFIKSDKPIIAICGKSNVGKSSFINMVTNRKKLANAFSVKSPLVKMFYLSAGEELDLVLFSDKDRAITVNTSRIPLKTTRSTQGISVMTSKKNSVVENVVRAEAAELKNIERFRTKSIPAAGPVVRDEDKGIEQTKF